MDIPLTKNVDRMLDLLWKNYQEQVTVNRRISDRTAVILGGSVAAIGLLLKSSSASAVAGWMLPAAAVFLLGAFVAAVMLWLPYGGSQPGSTDIDSIWTHTIAVVEDNAAANMMQDLCAAIRAARCVTDSLRVRFTCFILCCSASVLLAAASTML